MRLSRIRPASGAYRANPSVRSLKEGDERTARPVICAMAGLPSRTRDAPPAPGSKPRTGRGKRQRAGPPSACPLRPWGRRKTLPEEETAMPFTDDKSRLAVEIKSKGCEVPKDEQARLQ